MSIDERLFGWLHRTWREARTRASEHGQHAVVLEPIAGRLALLASALAGVAIDVRAAEDIGGVRDTTLLLPAVVDRYDAEAANLEVYLYRVVYGVHSRTLGLSVAGIPASSHALASLLAVPATRAALARELPTCAAMLARLHAAAARGQAPQSTVSHTDRRIVDALLFDDVAPDHAPSWLHALLERPPADQAALRCACVELERLAPMLSTAAASEALLFGRLMRPPSPPAAGPDPGAARTSPPPAGATERQAPQRDEVEVIELAARPEDDNPLVHSFEKVHTLDDYKGGSKRDDGEDQLDEQLAALDELDLRQVIRTGETAQSVYRLDALFEGGPDESRGNEQTQARPYRRYDEWDDRKRAYRPDWCTLYLESPPKPASAARVATRLLRVRQAQATTHRELRAVLEALEIERRWRTRQLDGPEIDLDAAVDQRAALAAARVPSERVYADRRRHAREVATLILLDLSLSSDSFVDNRRILDVGQDAMIVLGDVLEHARDEFAVAGFSSHTRRDCRWLTLKSFESSWAEALPRLLAVQANGYTRIGPALRHGMHTLAAHPARRRLLLLVTDGRPTDYDHYEGRYGIEDIRQAFREAEAMGVHPFALTIADTVTPLLPRLFGLGRFETLPHPDALARALAGVYARVAH